ncbi:MAG: hypothetical protein ABIP94_18550 [Planctomycetota bacterium]
MIVPNAIGALSLHPGFDVPSDLPSRQLWLVLALHERSIDAAVLDELDRRLGGDVNPLASPASPAPAATAVVEAWVERRSRGVLEWLAARGFTAHRLAVSCK